MPIGVIVNACAVVLGGLCGGLLGHRIPSEIKSNLNLVFGLASMLLGISAMGLVQNLSAVILALIIGTLVGILMKFGMRMNQFGELLERPFAKVTGAAYDGLSREEFLVQLVTAIVLFCSSGTGIYGAMDAAMSGDHSILIAKSILDFFTAAIFACNLGYVVSLIAVPQFVIFTVLFLFGRQIMPLTTPAMLADFRACGGVIMLATGFRLTKIKLFPVADMIPSLVVVMPLSWLWVSWIAPLLK